MACLRVIYNRDCMDALFNILLHSIGSLFIGVFITLVGMSLMLFIIKSWHKNRVFTPLSLIISVLLFFILVYHSIIICGAITIKGYGDKMEGLINSYVSNIPDETVFSQEDSQNILEHLNDDLPLVGYYARWADFRGHTSSDIAESMNETMQSFMNEYIVKHLLWILVFIIIGAFCIIRSMDGVKVARRASRHSRTKIYDE